MASTTPKVPCVTCSKNIGLFKCEGCAQTFCTKHVVEHRQTLHHQLDEVATEHDILHDTISKNKDEKHPLSAYIDEWEQKSIEKIQLIAKETREKLVELADINRGMLSEELNYLTQRIKKAREEDDFFETDLKSWVTILDQLRQELKKVPLSIDIKEDQTIPLIYQLKLRTIATSELNNKTTIKQQQIKPMMNQCEEMFKDCLDGAKIKENGRLIIHDKFNKSVAVRGKCEYSFGIHQFRLQIEKNPIGTWIFLGIISKSSIPTKNSYECSSAYGWADFNDFFLAGVRQNNQTSGQFSETRENDIISIVFDCDNQKISYTNERNQQSQLINIDIDKCPFPWQLHVNLFGADDRVRLLSTTSV